jgi:putative SOS response-associated peptidase YedK
MCGRFGYCLTKEEVEERFGVKKAPSGLAPMYNAAPGTEIPVILNTSKDELSFLRWGLVPHWSKWEKPGFNLINAKAETVVEKPMFKPLVRSKRCLILANGFYEWKKVGQRKIPYRILMTDERPFAFAGLWDSWLHDGQELKTCLIITTTPNALARTIHDRMPVILTPDKECAWLGEEMPLEQVDEFLRPYDAKKMKAYEISTEINSPEHNSPSVIQPI